MVLFFTMQSSFAMNLMSMNVRCLKDNWQKRIEHILTEAIKQNVDILALQELCQYKSEDSFEFVKKLLYKKTGKYWYSSKHFMHIAWDQYDEYVAIFSKHPPEKIDAGFLPASPLQRAYSALKIKGRYYVSVHLEHKDEYSQYRYQQIRFLLNKFQNEKTVLMGDFNSDEHWNEQQVLHQKKWRAYFPDLSYPSHAPYKAIDGFWLSPQFDLNVKGFKRLLDRPIEGEMFPSDHFAVLLNL